MRYLNKKKNREDGAGYWSTFGDLMSGVLIVFMLLFIYTLYNYQTTMSKNEKIIEELNSTRVEIINKLKAEFEKEDIEIEIDSKTGAIRLSAGVLYDFGKSELKDDGKQFLERFIPKYLKVLLDDEEIKKHVSQIIIEGHTDSNSSYIYNLKLSQERAFSVVEFILSDNFAYENKEDLEKYLTANGRSFSELIKEDDGTVNEEKSRRVEIKFRLNEEETLIRIQEELQKGTD